MAFDNQPALALVAEAGGMAILIEPSAYTFGTNEAAAIIGTHDESETVSNPRVEFVFDDPGSINERTRVQIVSGMMAGQSQSQVLLFSERRDGTEVAQVIIDTEEFFADIQGSSNQLLLNASGLTIVGPVVINGSRALRRADVQQKSGRASAVLTLGTSNADITGAAFTVTTQFASCEYAVTAFFDFDCVAVSAGVTCAGVLVVDGAAQTGEAIFEATATGQRATVGQTWTGVLGAGGSHTFKLQARKTGAGGTYSAQSTHTALSGTLVEVPA